MNCSAYIHIPRKSPLTIEYKWQTKDEEKNIHDKKKRTGITITSVKCMA